MKLIDVSMEIKEDMQVFNNRSENAPKIKRVREFANGGVNQTRIEYDLHSGTHLDMPLHMIEDGDDTDTFDIEALFGIEVRVLDLSNVKDKITKIDLANLDIKENDFLLFKTSSSYTDKFMFDFVFISLDAVLFLVEKKIKGVAIDSLGIERSQEGHPSHKLLFENNIMVIEGLRLKDVKQGKYTMYALPIRIKGVEAATLRVLLST